MTRVDRSRLPEPGPDRPFHFPRVAKRRLSNGLELRAVRHRDAPVANVTALVPGGASADPDHRPGLVSLTTDLLAEGCRGQSALEFADRISLIGGDLDLDVNHDAMVVSLTALHRFLETDLELVRDIVIEPNLAAEDFERVRALRLDRLRQISVHAPAIADRALARVVYGEHPYGHAILGTRMSLTSAALEDVRALHAAAFVPEHSTAVIVADVDEGALLDLGERTFGAWRGPAGGAASVDREAGLRPSPPGPAVRVGVVPRAGAAQSELRIGLVSAARATPDYYALVLLNAVLGGQFVSRINMRLRQEKGYTYGVRTAFDFRRGRGPFVLQTAVATDATASAVADALSELAGVAAARPVTADELALARASLAKGYPRGFETAAQVGRSVAHLALHDLPDSTFEDFIPRLDAVSVDEVTAVACKYLDRSRMAVVIVGDWDRISGLPSGLGDGQPVEITVEF